MNKTQYDTKLWYRFQYLGFVKGFKLFHSHYHCHSSIMAFKTNLNENEKEQVPYTVEQPEVEDDDDDDEMEEEKWDEWEGDEGGSDSQFVCLFCDSNYSSSSSLFQHCASDHHFDFHSVRNSLNLDFYASFKLINYIRSQVINQ